MMVHVCRGLVRQLATRGHHRPSSEHVASLLWKNSRVFETGCAASLQHHPDLHTGGPLSIAQARRSYAIAPKTVTPRSKKATTAASRAKKSGATTKRVRRAKTGASGTARKSTTIRKPAKKAKKPAAAKTRVARKKKPLTEVEKKKAEGRELRKARLVEPRRLPDSAWTVLLSELSKQRHGLAAKEASQQFKALGPAELERYNHMANQNKAANQVAYKKWVESHSADDIRKANNARRRLHRLAPNKKQSKPIQDPRLPRQPVSTFSVFVRDRFKSGDFKHMQAPEGMRLAAQEWKQLSSSEIQEYKKRYEADMMRYQHEYKTVYNRDAPIVGQRRKTSAAKTASTTS